MRVELRKLLEKLGVNRDLSPYETHPWFYYDEAQGITCSAEVRMGPPNEDVEAEIQFLYDTPLVSPSEDASQESTDALSRLQVMRMRAIPSSDSSWSPVDLNVKGESFVNKIFNWEEKGCDFFRNCVQAIQMNEVPNIDQLMKQDLHDDDGEGKGGRGRIGRKSPKINASNVLGMKKGM
jgi:hypothetical protein